MHSISVALAQWLSLVTQQYLEEIICGYAVKQSMVAVSLHTVVHTVLNYALCCTAPAYASDEGSCAPARLPITLWNAGGQAPIPIDMNPSPEPLPLVGP
jgi:hypothetical protein